MSEMRDLLGRCTTRKIGSAQNRPRLCRRLTRFRSASLHGDAFRGSALHAAGDAHAEHNDGVRILAIQADWGGVLIKTVAAFIKIGNVVCEHGCPRPQSCGGPAFAGINRSICGPRDCQHSVSHRAARPPASKPHSLCNAL